MWLTKERGPTPLQDPNKEQTKNKKYSLVCEQFPS